MPPTSSLNLQFKHKEALVLSGRDVTAVLGPTNTGKTHLAIERMVAHDSGVIGLPLRLLAREVYNRVVEKVGVGKVALITGEEKIRPAGARFSVCTVEAMPRETDASFVAIDEVQLAGDLERGHIFTDRLLHLRGRYETLLLGAGTMRGILERLLKGLSVVTRPRLSHLAYAGQKKLTRLPRRSAIVAFTADEVYAIAELVRRQRGGAAVVLGALSPRTRNAQVELYQSGDVDYLIATDAIGMGLNLDLDHVAFAQNRKFDGYQYRNLSPGELGQIAGRAGRHVRDGTFGVTGQVDPFEEELVERIEGHDFDPVKVLQWRSPAFDFSSLDALKRSMEQPAPVEGLTRALPAVDARALDHLSREPEIRDLATTPERVALLWETCALPDYRRIAPAQHADLIASMYYDLAERGHVNEAYMAEQVRRADSTEGEIDTLSHRIAQIRTWTFVSNRPGWLADPAHWQEKTRDIEDRLSDALHERLTKRFVDRRTSVLMRRLRENSMLEAEISPAGTVTVEGHHVGELQGFRFTADQSAGGEDAKAVRGAAQKALAAEFEARAERFGAAANGDIALGSDGILRWIGAPIGVLTAGEEALRPKLIVLADEQLTGPARDKVAARAERFVTFQIESLLKPLVELKAAEQLSGIARGLAFQLAEQFGLIVRREIAEDVRSLDQAGRAALRGLGVRFGAYHLFIPALIKPAPAGLITLLWTLKNDAKDRPGFGDVVHALAAGRTSVVVDPSYERTFYKLAGFRVLGRRAVRVDILERLADLIRPALAYKPGISARPDGAYDGTAFIVTPAMMSILGANAEDIEEILKGLGYRAEPKTAADVHARMAALEAEARARTEQAEAQRRAAAEKDAAEATADAGTAAEESRSEPAVAEGTAEPVIADQAAPEEPGELDDSGAALTSPPVFAVAAGESSQQRHEIGAVAASAAPVLAEPAGSGETRSEVAGALPHASFEPSVNPGEAASDDLRSETAAASIPGADEAPGEQTVAAPHSAAQGYGSPGEGVAHLPSVEDEVPPADGGATADRAADPALAAAEEPKPILLWRPGRFEQRRGGQRDSRQRGERTGRNPGRGRPDQAPSAAGAAGGDGQPVPRQRSDAAAPAGRSERPAGQARHRGRGRPQDPAQAEGQASGSLEREGRNGREKGAAEGGPRQGRRPDRRPGDVRNGAGHEQDRGSRDRPAPRQDMKPSFRAAREERPVRIDPDSPFAKLAALRDQLKK